MAFKKDYKFKNNNKEKIGNRIKVFSGEGYFMFH